MNVWEEIDKLKARHDAELAETERQVQVLGGGKPQLDELGVWRCSWRPKSGDRTTQHPCARSGPGLVDALKVAQRLHEKRTQAAREQARE